MKAHALACLMALLLVGGCDSKKPSDTSEGVYENQKTVQGTDSTLDAQLTPISTIEAAYANNQSNIQVLVKGTVTKLLADDVTGDKHQRMIVKLSNKQTLLIAHNIDIGTRVPASCLNRIIYAHGEYEWNSEGGVVHWTHSDPDGVHTNGWIQFAGTRYQ